MGSPDPVTTYVTDTAHAGDRFHLWADDPDEACCALYGCGSTLEARGPSTKWLAYEITEHEWAGAVAAGARLMTRDETVRWIRERGLAS